MPESVCPQLLSVTDPVCGGPVSPCSGRYNPPFSPDPQVASCSGGPSSPWHGGHAAVASGAPVCFSALAPGACPTEPSASHAAVHETGRHECAPAWGGADGVLCASSVLDRTRLSSARGGHTSVRNAPPPCPPLFFLGFWSRGCDDSPCLAPRAGVRTCLRVCERGTGPSVPGGR